MIGSDIGTTNDGRNGPNSTHISMNSRNIPIINNRNPGNNNKKNSPSSSVMQTPIGSTKQQAGKFIFTSANLNKTVAATEKTSHTTNFS
jgi:hypothetical protein